MAVETSAAIVFAGTKWRAMADAAQAGDLTSLEEVLAADLTG
jgi:hypothetical protein